jgi:hypothetical protein
MLAVMVIAIFLIPVTFYVVENLTGKGKKQIMEAIPEDASAPATGD